MTTRYLTALIGTPAAERLQACFEDPSLLDAALAEASALDAEVARLKINVDGLARALAGAVAESDRSQARAIAPHPASVEQGPREQGEALRKVLAGQVGQQLRTAPQAIGADGQGEVAEGLLVVGNGAGGDRVPVAAIVAGEAEQGRSRTDGLEADAATILGVGAEGTRRSTPVPGSGLVEGDSLDHDGKIDSPFGAVKSTSVEQGVVTVEYRAGLPTAEQVKAHEERDGLWCALISIQKDGAGVPCFYRGDMLLREWAPKVLACRPCLPDGTPCGWPGETQSAAIPPQSKAAIGAWREVTADEPPIGEHFAALWMVQGATFDVALAERRGDLWYELEGGIQSDQEDREVCAPSLWMPLPARSPTRGEPTKSGVDRLRCDGGHVMERGDGEAWAQWPEGSDFPTRTAERFTVDATSDVDVPMVPARGGVQ